MIKRIFNKQKASTSATDQTAVTDSTPSLAAGIVNPLNPSGSVLVNSTSSSTNNQASIVFNEPELLNTSDNNDTISSFLINKEPPTNTAPINSTEIPTESINPTISTSSSIINRIRSQIESVVKQSTAKPSQPVHQSKSSIKKQENDKNATKFFKESVPCAITEPILSNETPNSTEIETCQESTTDNKSAESTPSSAVVIVAVEEANDNNIEQDLEELKNLEELNQLIDKEVEAEQQQKLQDEQNQKTITKEDGIKLSAECLATIRMNKEEPFSNKITTSIETKSKSRNNSIELQLNNFKLPQSPTPSSHSQSAVTIEYPLRARILRHLSSSNANSASLLNKEYNNNSNNNNNNNNLLSLSGYSLNQSYNNSSTTSSNSSSSSNLNLLQQLHLQQQQYHINKQQQKQSSLTQQQLPHQLCINNESLDLGMSGRRQSWGSYSQLSTTATNNHHHKPCENCHNQTSVQNHNNSQKFLNPNFFYYSPNNNHPNSSHSPSSSPTTASVPNNTGADPKTPSISNIHMLLNQHKLMTNKQQKGDTHDNLVRIKSNSKLGSSAPNLLSQSFKELSSLSRKNSTNTRRPTMQQHYNQHHSHHHHNQNVKSSNNCYCQQQQQRHNSNTSCSSSNSVSSSSPTVKLKLSQNNLLRHHNSNCFDSASRTTTPPSSQFQQSNPVPALHPKAIENLLDIDSSNGSARRWSFASMHSVNSSGYESSQNHPTGAVPTPATLDSTSTGSPHSPPVNLLMPFPLSSSSSSSSSSASSYSSSFTAANVNPLKLQLQKQHYQQHNNLLKQNTVPQQSEPKTIPDNNNDSCPNIPINNNNQEPIRSRICSSSNDSSSQLDDSIDSNSLLFMQQQLPPHPHSCGGPIFQRQRARSLSCSPSVKSLRINDSDVILLQNDRFKERFPNACQQMEHNLMKFIQRHQLDKNDEDDDDNDNEKADPLNQLDPVARFIQKQLCEITKLCLDKSKQNELSSSYFDEITSSLENLLAEAQEKCNEDTVTRTMQHVHRLSNELLLIVSRVARLLECLEFDPAQFSHLLDAAEVQATQHVIKTDIPKYIISKLGLNRDLFQEFAASVQREDEEEEEDIEEEEEIKKKKKMKKKKQSVSSSTALSSMIISHKTPNENDFEHIKLISNGAYGLVNLVRLRSTGERYAMKKIRKNRLVLRNQLQQVFTERDIMIFTDNPFVVALVCTFETKKHLCMVMEYVEGGDVATLIKNMGALPVDMARAYFAETTLAVEYLHNYGIIHRDLKPDNLLITSLGHIKLTDFGLSKVGLMNLTTNFYEGNSHLYQQNQTENNNNNQNGNNNNINCNKKENYCKEFNDKQICGTPQYLAPEVILRQSYGKAVDWWSMGVILYEFLTSVAPFNGQTPDDLFANVIGGELQWPDPDDQISVGEDAQNLIERLLQRTPLLRLGAGGAHEIKQHPFFVCLDWDNLLRVKAEFIPQLDGPYDTSYFDTRSERYNHDDDDEDNDDDDDDEFRELEEINNSQRRGRKVVESHDESSPSPNLLNMVQKKLLDIQRRDTNEGDDENDNNDDEGTNNRQELTLPLDLLENNELFASFSSCSSRFRLNSNNSPVIMTNTTPSSNNASLVPPPPTVIAATVGMVKKNNDLIEIYCEQYQSPLKSPNVKVVADLVKEIEKQKKDEELEDADEQTLVNELNSLQLNSKKVNLVVIDENKEGLKSDEENKKKSVTTPETPQQQPDIRLIAPTPLLTREAVVPEPLPSQQLPKLLSLPSSESESSSSSLNLKNNSKVQNKIIQKGSNEQKAGIYSSYLPPFLYHHNLPSSFPYQIPGINTNQQQIHHFHDTDKNKNNPIMEMLAVANKTLPIQIRRTNAHSGFGFTLRAIKVYDAGNSDFYTIQHLIIQVDEKGAAYAAGLRAQHLITHVNEQIVCGLMHHEVVQLIMLAANKTDTVASGGVLSLRTIPLSQTNIKTDGRKRSPFMSKLKTVNNNIQNQNNNGGLLKTTAAVLASGIPIILHPSSGSSGIGSNSSSANSSLGGGNNNNNSGGGGGSFVQNFCSSLTSPFQLKNRRSLGNGGGGHGAFGLFFHHTAASNQQNNDQYLTGSAQIERKKKTTLFRKLSEKRAHKYEFMQQMQQQQQQSRQNSFSNNFSSGSSSSSASSASSSPTIATAGGGTGALLHQFQFPFHPSHVHHLQQQQQQYYPNQQQQSAFHHHQQQLQHYPPPYGYQQQQSNLIDKQEQKRNVSIPDLRLSFYNNLNLNNSNTNLQQQQYNTPSNQLSSPASSPVSKSASPAFSHHHSNSLTAATMLFSNQNRPQSLIVGNMKINQNNNKKNSSSYLSKLIPPPLPLSSLTQTPPPPPPSHHPNPMQYSTMNNNQEPRSVSLLSSPLLMSSSSSSSVLSSSSSSQLFNSMYYFQSIQPHHHQPQVQPQQQKEQQLKQEETVKNEPPMNSS